MPEESALLESLWIGNRCDEIERLQQHNIALAATFPDEDLEEIMKGLALLNNLPLSRREWLNPDVPLDQWLNPDVPLDQQGLKDEDDDKLRHDVASTIGRRSYVVIGSGRGRRVPGEKTRPEIMREVADKASIKFGRKISSRMVERAWKFSRALAAQQEAELDAEDAERLLFTLLLWLALIEDAQARHL